MGLGFFLAGLIPAAVALFVNIASSTSHGGIRIFAVLFSIPFVLIGAIFMLLGFYMLFLRCRIVIGDKDILIVKKVLGFSNEKRLALNEIKHVKLLPNGQQGSKVWYDLGLDLVEKIDETNSRDRLRNRVTIPSGIPEKKESQWLAQKLEQKISSKRVA